MNQEIIKLKFEKFLLEYGSKYDNYALNFIKQNFFKFMYTKHVPDILMQIYSELGIYDDSNNFYKAHLNNIQRDFNIKSNILEVGCGFLPALGNLIASRQLQLGKGTVTLYDPELIIKKAKYSNMKLYKKQFNHNINVANYDLLVGILPCDATEEIIRSACMNKKDFYVAMCGCNHLGPFIPYDNYIISLAEELLEKYDNGSLQIKRLSKEYEIDYPILYNKKS